MTEVDIQKLFHDLMVNVLWLTKEPDQDRNSPIYSNGRLNIPVFMGEDGVATFYRIIAERADVAEFQEATQGRLFFLNNSTFSLGAEESYREFPFQMIFNSHEGDYSIKLIDNEFLPLLENDSAEARTLVCEAYFCAYFMHEFRHVIQITEGVDVSTVYKREKIFPVPTNTLIPTEKLTAYWNEFVHDQMVEYRKIASLLNSELLDAKTFLNREVDALQIQFYALDCWLTTSYSREEKFVRLRRLLRTQ